MTLSRLFALTLICCGSTAPLHAADVVASGGSFGVVAPGKLPSAWSDDKLAWKVSLPGAAWSCPIVVGDKLFLTTAYSENQPKPRGSGAGGRPGGGAPGGPPGGGRPGGGGGGGRGAPTAEYEFKIICLDRATGKTLWDDVALKARPAVPTHGSNTFASESPVSDGERVFAYFGPNGLYCYDLNGKQLWKKNFGTKAMQNGWGTASSPVLDGGRLYIQCDNEEESFITALDAKTGDELWKVKRSEKSTWSTPYLWKQKDRTDLVAIGSRKIVGYDPANGNVVWELDAGGGQCAASPVGDAERLYVGTSASGGGRGRPGGAGGDAPRSTAAPGTIFCVKAGASGDISLIAGESSNAAIAWTAQRAWPAASTPLLYQDHVYLLERNGGIVSCFNATTGKLAYKERLSGAKAFWASPWAADGLIYCLDEDGQTHVLKAGPEFDVVSVNKLGKDVYWATPALAQNTIYIRGIDTLACIRDQ